MAAGHCGASGRPVRGRVGLESRVPKETVITQCKINFSAKNTSQSSKVFLVLTLDLHLTYYCNPLYGKNKASDFT